MKKKITEFKEATWSPLTWKEEVDETTGEKRMRIQGIFQEADSVNQNRRIYPKDVMKEAVDEIKVRCASRRVFGEVDHPFFYGSLRDTAHLITDLWWNPENQNQLCGEALVLNTPTGLVMQEIVRAGGRPGISSRGHGDAEEIDIDGVGKVQKIKPGFRFDSFDFVMDPSVKAAQITKVMEQLEIPGDQNEEETDMEKPNVETPEAKETEKKAEETESKVEETEKKAEEPEKKVEEAKEEVKAEETAPEIIDEGDEDEDEAKEDKEEATKLEDSSVAEELGTLRRTVESLTTEVTTLKNELSVKTKEVEDFKEAARKVEVEAYINQKVAGNQFELVLRKRLAEADYKTKEEVDAALGGYAELIEAFNGQEAVFGKGHGKKTVEQSSPNGTSSIEENIKRKAGIRPKEAK